jgi:putative ABC transport system permease protein
MLISLAWKNIWRNKKRSSIIIVAIAFGMWGGLLSGALMMGMGESIVNTAIDRDLSHIQIHEKNFLVEKELTNFIPNAQDVMTQIKSMNGVTAVSGRTLIEGMASSPNSSYGVKIVGINSGNAKMVTNINEKIVEGCYFETDYKNQMVIGQKLAKRLNLKLHSKMVLSFQGLDGSIVYIACRIVGIYKSESAMFDEMNVFVEQTDLFRVLNTEPIIHEIAIRTESSKVMPITDEALKAKFPNLAVQSWKEIAPEIAFLSVTMENFTYLFVAIILFALLFGITNTMLMSVVDRIRELGVLIAVGMKKAKVAMMILLETIFLSITGGFLGILMGGLSILYFSFSGINLSAFSSSVESFGTSAILYPFLPAVMYITLTIMIIFAANIAALMPAWKAIHIHPSEAIRTY